MSRRTMIALYVLFGFACLGVSALLTFPYDVLGRYLETEVARAAPGAAITINRIGPSLPLGLYMGDIVYEPPASDPDATTRFEIANVRLHPAWLKLLTLKPGVSFAVGVLGGKIAGTAWLGGGNQHLEVAATGVHIEDGGQFEKLTGLDLQGTLAGKLSAVVGAPVVKGGVPVITEGSLTASVDGAEVRGGKVMGFPIPQTDLGSPEVEVDITKGEATIQKLQTRSHDIDLTTTGSVSIRPALAQSPLRGSLKVKLSDEWFARNPSIKGLIGMAGPFKKADGSLELPLNGTLARPLSLPGFGGF
jgi:type II secretion system protein N